MDDLTLFSTSHNSVASRQHHRHHGRDYFAKLDTKRTVYARWPTARSFVGTHTSCHGGIGTCLVIASSRVAVVVLLVPASFASLVRVVAVVFHWRIANKAVFELGPRV
jgi:hypothetical protein